MAFVARFIINIFLLLLLLQYAPVLVRNIKATYENLLEPHTKVGVISISGSVEDSSTPAKNLKKFFEDKDIQAILIQIDSPGGAAGASQALFNEIKEAKKVHLKPVITWVQNICASGGYYIASASDHIIASPASLIGNIAAYTTAGGPALDLAPDQKTELHHAVIDINQQFAGDVAAQRPQLSLQQLKTWADGKMFSGAQALKLGLVDELGSQITVEQYIKQKIHVEKSIEWVQPESKFCVIQWLTSHDCGEEALC